MVNVRGPAYGQDQGRNVTRGLTARHWEPVTYHFQQMQTEMFMIRSGYFELRFVKIFLRFGTFIMMSVDYQNIN